MARGKKKTKARKSCPSGRAYASGKKKGRCVPKGKARKVTAKKGKRGCWSKTRDLAIQKMDLFKKNALEREQKRAAQDQSQAQWDASRRDVLEGLGRSRKRRRR
jgi:hypothetical protein